MRRHPRRLHSRCSGGDPRVAVAAAMAVTAAHRDAASTGLPDAVWVDDVLEHATAVMPVGTTVPRQAAATALRAHLGHVLIVGYTDAWGTTRAVSAMDHDVDLPWTPVVPTPEYDGAPGVGLELLAVLELRTAQDRVLHAARKAGAPVLVDAEERRALLLRYAAVLDRHEHQHRRSGNESALYAAVHAAHHLAAYGQAVLDGDPRAYVRTAYAAWRAA